MAKPSRGLPDSFSLDLPDEGPVFIGDFLDENPPMPVARKQKPVPAEPPKPAFRPEIVRDERETPGERARPVPRNAAQQSIIRYQLNLTPKAKGMFEELVEH